MTPDHVAVYGSLRRGHGVMPQLNRNGALVFRGQGWIAGRLYDLGPYPGLMAGDGRVAAEIYRIRDAAILAALDDYEDFDPDDPAGSMFLRQAVTLVRPKLRAWVYFYNGAVGRQPRIHSGDWNAYTGVRA